MRDHRLLGWGTIANDAATFVRVIRSAVELAPDASYRDDHLRICARGTLSRMALCGTREGGAFENPFLRVTEVDAQGRILCHDTYDESDLERVLARFAELAAPAASEGRFENVASCAWRAVNDAWTARDLERFAAPHAAALRYRDHRRLFELDLDRAGFLDFTRPLLTMRAGDASLDLVATRGERLALMHSVMRMEDESVGPSVIESLMLVETDERGDIAAYDRWDLEDEDAAWAEIDARWTSGEGPQHPGLTTFSDFFAALERREWDAAAACYAADFVGHDHRLVSWGTVRGPGALVRTLQEMVSLAPDVRMRSNHQRACARGAIVHNIWVGTREGGAFESPFVCVGEFGADGRFIRADFYDPHHLDRAFARFEEIRAIERSDPRATRVRPNLATAAMERNWTAFDALDLAAADAALDAARAHYAPDFVWDDRRPLVGLSGDLELMLASVRERLVMGARQQRTIVATAGDRVAIGRVLWAGGPEDGRFEVEFLVVSEVDEAGLFTALIFFEPGDTRGAQREAWARWAAIEPAVAPWVELLNAATDAWNARDRAAILDRFADDVVVEDHRHTGIGRIEGSAAYVDANAVLWDLAPDQRVEFSSSFLAFDPHVLVVTLRRAGTLADGGAFESEYVWLSLARDGRINHLELFEIEQQAAALARFEELRPDPLPIPQTTATRMRDRHRDAFLARDWRAMRALASADFVYEDRGRRALVRGDVEPWIASQQFTTQPGFRADTALIGTLGDRIVLDHCRWFGKPDGDAFEFERVRLLEVGADGLLRAVLFFDPEDRSAASIEGLARFAASEAAGSAGVAPLLALLRALDGRDWEAARACFAPDLVLVDHRPLSLGTLDREQWIASLQATYELSVGLSWDVFRALASSERGWVIGIRRLGSIPDGGGRFENEFYTTTLVVDGRIQRFEVFGEADAERAVARFAELCAEGSA
jgi:ketosteroid isomerase-like protein